MKALPLLILAATALPAWTFAFSVSPMVVEFDPNTSRAQQVFVLSNTSNREKPIEISVAKPELDEDGIEILEMGQGEDEFLIMPQQLTLPPNSRRSVKVFYVGNPREEEDSYRFVFKELPVELAQESLPEGESSFSMRIVMQYNTRVWLTPSGLKEELAVTEFSKVDLPAPQTSRRESESESELPSEPTPTVPMLRLTVANTGLAHGYIRYPKIAFVKRDGSRQQVPTEALRLVSGQVVFKESEKQFNIAWQEDFPSLQDVERIDLQTKRL